MYNVRQRGETDKIIEKVKTHVAKQIQACCRQYELLNGSTITRIKKTWNTRVNFNELGEGRGTVMPMKM